MLDPSDTAAREVRVEGRVWGAQEASWSAWAPVTELHPRADTALAEEAARGYLNRPGRRQSRVVVVFSAAPPGDALEPRSGASAPAR